MKKRKRTFNRRLRSRILGGVGRSLDSGLALIAVVIGAVLLAGIGAACSGAATGNESNAQLEGQLSAIQPATTWAQFFSPGVSSAVCTTAPHSATANVAMRVCNLVSGGFNCLNKSGDSGERLVIRVTGDHYSILNSRTTFSGTCDDPGTLP
jgi:hypothetical protein